MMYVFLFYGGGFQDYLKVNFVLSRKFFVEQGELLL